MGQESRRLPGFLLIPINQAVDAKQITDTLTGPAGGGGRLPGVTVRESGDWVRTMSLVEPGIINTIN